MIFFVNSCKSNSNKKEFGLCDDPPPSTRPAYIDELDKSKWIATISNINSKQVEFIAIDACIDIRKTDGNLESRCDGLISYDNDLIFVELKSRESGKWVKKGRQQLTITVDNFKRNNNISDYNNISANICNSLRPQSHSSHAVNIQQFYDDTGLVLRTDNTIIIP